MTRRVTVGGLTLELTEAQEQELREQLKVSGMSDTGQPLSTAEAAEAIGMSPDYVRDHAEELGGELRGNRWRFDPARLQASRRHEPDPSPPTRPRQRRRRGKKPDRPLLEVRG